MTRIEDRAHYVYKHYDNDERLLYVGMTARPNVRPYETRKRAWVAQSFRVEISPPMSHAAAVFVERSLIRLAKTFGEAAHNIRVCSPNAAPTDLKIVALAEKHGWTRAQARALYPIWPDEPDAA